MALMPPPKSPPLAFISVKVRPSLKKALELAAADRQVTMSHVVITALAAHLRRTGYFRIRPSKRIKSQTARIVAVRKENKKKVRPDLGGRRIGSRRSFG